MSRRDRVHGILMRRLADHAGTRAAAPTEFEIIADLAKAGDHTTPQSVRMILHGLGPKRARCVEKGQLGMARWCAAAVAT